MLNYFTEPPRANKLFASHLHTKRYASSIRKLNFPDLDVSVVS